MSTDRRLLAGAFVLAVFVAACGGSGSNTPAPTNAGNSGNNPTSQPTAAGNGGATDQPTDAPFSLSPGSASELEKLIPSQVGTTVLTKTSLDFSGIPWTAFSGAAGSGGMEQILKDNGKTLADVKFAMGISTAPGASGMPTMVYAMQVKGLDAAKFVDGIDDTYATATESTISGKKVHGNITSGFGTVTYLHDDVVFTVIASEADLKDILAALP